MEFYDVSNIRIAFVIIREQTEKALIKECLDKMGIASQFITKFTLEEKLCKDRPVMGVYTNILR